jgi:aspartyl-tRNA(Asn)/glutamyl-tRNA(Gln) amidotransferase subunit A
LLPALPVPIHEQGLTRFTISGQMVPTSHIQTAAIPVNLTGLPALAMRFGSGSEGLPIAMLLESISPGRDQHPTI